MVRPDLYPIEGVPSVRLAIVGRPRGGDWLEDEIRALRQAGVDVLVSLLTPSEAAELELRQEEECCQACGLSYLSFPIQDRGVPNSVRDMAALVAKLRGFLGEGKHVAVHCRQGVGRSALVAASLLVALGFSTDRAFELVAAARGRPVPDTEQQRRWVEALAQRLAEDP